MNIDTMRRIDRHAGLPLCRLLTAVRALGRLLAPGRASAQPRRVLIIKLSEMGSTVLAWPAVAELRRRAADAELFFLTLEENRGIAEAMALTAPDNIVTLDSGSLARFVQSAWRAARRLRRAGIDTTIDMDFFSRFSAIAAYAICRGNRVGFHAYTSEAPRRGDLLTHRVLYSPHVHTSAAFLSLVRALLAGQTEEVLWKEHIDAAALECPRHEPAPAAAAGARKRLARKGITAEHGAVRLVLINPNSSQLFPLRRWPLDRYAELCRRLLESDPTIRLAVTGTAAEADDAAHILDRVQNPRCVSMAGETSFEELLALHAGADLLITNDSGPAHFAALLRLPTVALFGPETPALYAPANPACRCLYAGFACSPCVSVYNAKKSPCRRSRCLEAISVEQVLTAALGMLADRRRLGPARDPASG